MKVLCMIDGIGSGGAQRQLVGLAAMLKEKGIEVKVMYYHDVHFFRPFLNEHKVDCQYLPQGGNKWKKFVRLRKAVTAYSPDVVVAYLDGPAVMGCLLRLLGNKFRLIVSERSLTEYLNLKRWIKFWMYGYCDFIVTNSHSEESFIKRRFPRLTEKVRCITNFVDTNYFFPPLDKYYSQFSSVLNVLCVARIGPEKNVLLFLKAIHNLCGRGYPVKVRWFGHPATNEYYASCLELHKKLALEDIVCFEEASDQIREEYGKADLLCLPSLYEGFPNVIGEAMACGLPVLCSRVSDNAVIVEEGVNGFLFDPASLDELVMAFVRFVELPSEERYRMKKRNREKALRDFAQEEFVKKYLALFE